MAIKKPFEHPMGIYAQKKFGIPNGLGDTWLGVSILGNEDPYAGIFKTVKGKKERKTIKTKFYQQFKPRTENQKAAAQKWKNGMTEWQGLTNEEKNAYNERAKKLRIEGVNLFMREYMRSN